MELVSVAAVADNLVIGDDGEIPWESLPEDRKQYRDRVRDDPVILGRRTFESMRDDLPGRIQIVMSQRLESVEPNSVVLADTVEDAIDAARDTGADTVYVLGGGKIYHLLQPHLDRMVLSRVPGVYEGDATYPEWDEDAWELERETPWDGFTLQEWRRQSR